MIDVSDPGPLPELAWLPVDKCDVDPAYQRSIDNARSKKLIAKIAAEFKWVLFQAVQATPGGPGWLIFDGQHRVAAAKSRGITHVPAIVVAELSQAQQAMAFVGANRDRVPVTAQAIHHAQLLARDPKAQAVDRVCKAAGIELLRYQVGAKLVPAGKTTALFALTELIRLHGETSAARTVRAVAEAWHSERGALRSPVLLGAGVYLAGGGDVEALTIALRKHGYAKLEQAIAGDRNQRAQSATVAETMRGWVEGWPLTVAVPAPAALREAAPVQSAPPAKPETAASKVRSIFEDDPRAKRDHGSFEKLGRAEAFGRSVTGSSLA